MDKHILPLVALKGIVVFPGNIITFDVGREQSVNSIEHAIKYDTEILLITQRNHEVDNPTIDDLYKVGTVCKINQIMRFPEDRIRVLAHGQYKARLMDLIQTKPFMEGVTTQIINKGKEYIETKEDKAFVRGLIKKYNEYGVLRAKRTLDLSGIVSRFGYDLDKLTYELGNDIEVEYEIKQEVLEEVDPQERAQKLIGILINEIEILSIEKDINIKVQQRINKVQRNSYLKEQIKVIKSELGEKDSLTEEIEDFKDKAEKSNLPEEVYDKAMKEISRLSTMMHGSAEVSVISNYLNLLLSLPWNTNTQERIDIGEAESILNRDHYGLEDIKERILEYLAVRKMDNSLKGPIICLVGPPGVGKTSIARSIAESLNRKYVKMSLGGIKDESEIRGHRRTYVGAMCGRVISAIKQGDSNNPLILLDEIDKMSNDFRGDPASAMLEVLDSEQNHSFRDNYLELPFDLSEVLFVATANNAESIPRPLLDRMEIINVSSYTLEEKFNIAKKYLLPKQLKMHGLTPSKVRVRDEAMRDIISGYTLEAGVRKLEQQIAKLCRKVAKQIVEGERKTMTVTQNNLESLLGTRKRVEKNISDKEEVGLANGLAWTSVGGVILNIEVNVMPGTGKVELTGQLGSVMKESALAAISYIRSKADLFGIDKNFNTKNDIHIHVPEGATPKDGPSAGITLATALVSALTQTPCKVGVAMTGEITIRGRVLQIGGLKEKALAAHRAGIKVVIIPESNEKDLKDIPADVRKEIKFVTATTMDTVLETALTNSDFKKEKMDSVISQVVDDGCSDFVTDVM